MSIQLEMLHVPGAGPGREPAGEQETSGADYDGNGLPALTDKGLVSPGWESAARVCQVLAPGCSAPGRQLQEGELRPGSIQGSLHLIHTSH